MLRASADPGRGRCRAEICSMDVKLLIGNKSMPLKDQRSQQEQPSIYVSADRSSVFVKRRIAGSSTIDGQFNVQIASRASPALAYSHDAEADTRCAIPFSSRFTAAFFSDFVEY